MAVKTTQKEKNLIYFVTFTCYNWIPLFEITNAYDLVYKWFDYLKSKGHKITGFVIMPNHFHGLIYISPTGKTINSIIGNAKRFLAYDIIKRLKEQEEWILLLSLQEQVSERERKKGKLHQVFEPSWDIKPCFTPAFTAQKLHYMHNNPVSGKWRLAEYFTDYTHSSACFYELGKQGAYPVIDFRDIEYPDEEVGGHF